MLHQSSTALPNFTKQQYLDDPHADVPVTLLRPPHAQGQGLYNQRSSADDEELKCSVCFELEGEDPDKGELIRPTRGSCYHRSCLTRWRFRNMNPTYHNRDPVTKEPFQFYDIWDLPLLAPQSTEERESEARELYAQNRWRVCIVLFGICAAFILVSLVFGWLVYQWDTSRWLLATVELLFVSAIHRDVPKSAQEWHDHITANEMGFAHSTVFWYYFVVGIWLTCLCVHMYTALTLCAQSEACGTCCNDASLPYYQANCVYCDPCPCCIDGADPSACAGDCGTLDGDAALLVIPLCCIACIAVLVGGVVIVLYDGWRLSAMMTRNFDRALQAQSNELAHLQVVAPWTYKKPGQAAACRRVATLAVRRGPEEQDMMPRSHQTYGTSGAAHESPGPVCHCEVTVDLGKGDTHCFLRDALSLAPKGYFDNSKLLRPGRRYRMDAREPTGGRAPAARIVTVKLTPLKWDQRSDEWVVASAS
eukprot:TRINITY_DN12470_c0_g1_i1.p1 TRINITY_DN12470_c0_g1~~TRINITY_DN12470_c0_g1_i1.p1  ORF type:complete len:477 (+),score=42.35 TRINITY_DN12470_c0_g1_i1:68-1498(+)